MKSLIRNSRAVGKVTLSFTSLIIALALGIVVVGFVLSNRIDNLQTTNSQLQSQYDALQSQYNQLNTQYKQLQSSQSPSQTSETANLQSTIASLQSQLSDAMDLIAQLRGPSGIMPTYMNITLNRSNNHFYLHLSLKNTGNVPITQIFVMLNSVKVDVAFTYLNTTVNANTPLPPYEIASGLQDVDQIVLVVGNTLPLLIQASANNGTTYTYQTNITSRG